MRSLLIISLILALGLACDLQCCESLSNRPQMTYTYYQDSGRFIGGEGAWAISTFGYSGAAQYKNKPEAQCIKNFGPAPATTYTLSLCKNTMHNPPVIRPCSFWVTPLNEEEMCGRTEIFIHGCTCCTEGDLTEPPTDGCSAGCIIINEQNRIKLRVGDTLIVKHNDPLSISPQQYE